MKPYPPISVTILTKNNEQTLPRVLDALKEFPQVVVYDTGSTDETMTLARSYDNVDVVEAPFEGFGVCHNKALAYAKHDWILSIDSDEVVSEEMKEKLQSLSLDPRNVYRFPRHNTYRGRWIRHSGWFPDRQTRLFHRKETRFTLDAVHEGVATKGMEVVDIPTPIYHESYRCISEFLRKMEHYTSLFAEQHRGKKRSSFGKAVLHGVYAFIKTYVLQRGFLDGREGFEIAVYNGNTAFYKYLKLWEANRVLAKERHEESVDGPKKTAEKRLSHAKPTGLGESQPFPLPKTERAASERHTE